MNENVHSMNARTHTHTHKSPFKKCFNLEIDHLESWYRCQILQIDAVCMTNCKDEG